MRRITWVLGLGVSYCLVGLPAQVLAAPGRVACPTELQPLTNLLMRDLPGYVNRRSQQSRSRGRTTNLATYMVLAGQPELTPLPLTLGGATPAAASSELQQVFLTTLERQYVANNILEIQTYHWIFLTQTQRGWRLAMMFSRIGDYPAQTPPSPPRDTSQGIVAQAINAWLRDCEAGSIRAPRPGNS